MSSSEVQRDIESGQVWTEGQTVKVEMVRHMKHRDDDYAGRKVLEMQLPRIQKMGKTKE